MRTEAITLSIYKFRELSNKAQDKAIQDFIEHGMDGWDEGVLECAKDALSALGFSGINIEYSGFWSQGDGARVTGMWRASDVDMDGVDMLVGSWRESNADAGVLDQYASFLVDQQWVDVITSADRRLTCILSTYGYPRYYHEKSVDFNFDFDGDPANQPDCADLMQAFRDAMIWVYGLLETEYERATSHEEYGVLSDMGGWEYLEDGSLYNG